MATEVQNHSEPSVTSLVGGIVSDFQDLIKQQLRLTRQEIEADLRKTKETVSLLAVGAILCLLGAFTSCLMLAHLIHWLATPATAVAVDPATLPLWGCFGLVAAALWLAGGYMLLSAKKKVDEASSPLHDTAQGLKENLEWKTKASPS